MVFHKIPDIAILIFLSNCIVIVSIFGDRNLQNNTNYISRAIIDNLTHSIVGGCSWIIILVLMKQCLIENMLSILICFFTSSLIDMDHFITARSYKVYDATHLGIRPLLHCSTIPIILFFTLYYLSKILNILYINTFAWIVLISFMSHHIRDANRQGFWFAPFGSTPPIPQLLYLTLNIILPYVLYFCILISQSLLLKKSSKAYNV